MIFVFNAYQITSTAATVVFRQVTLNFVAGDNLFIPHDILKSPEVVACAVRNQITPMALSAVVKALISTCDELN